MYLVDIAWEVLFNDAMELSGAFNVGDVRSKKSRTVFALCVATSELAHEVGSLLHAKALDDQIVVPQHTGFLIN